MQVDHEVPLVSGDVVQRPLEHRARVLIECPGDADHDRAVTLDVRGDQCALLPPGAPAPSGLPILARRTPDGCVAR